jgi:hypothetical protein
MDCVFENRLLRTRCGLEKEGSDRRMEGIR